MGKLIRFIISLVISLMIIKYIDSRGYYEEYLLTAILWRGVIFAIVYGILGKLANTINEN